MGKNSQEEDQINMPQGFDTSNNSNTDSVAKAFDTLAKAVHPNQSLNQSSQVILTELIKTLKFMSEVSWVEYIYILYCFYFVIFL